jgi:16S rRNA (uracil1498-N3)-methyltransferase
VLRRIHTPRLAIGEITLDPAAARHARDVLRLTQGTAVELFDDAGASGPGTIVEAGPRGVVVRVETFSPADNAKRTGLTIASAVPKGERADWMIEKLSELGVERFIPLATARSVVLPEGKNKLLRWVRLATEAAKQSRRAGVMTIDPLTRAAEALRTGNGRFLLLSTGRDSLPILNAVQAEDRGSGIIAFVGPEGGWTEEEITEFSAVGAISVKLTPTVLRIETAAVAVAAVVCSARS